MSLISKLVICWVVEVDMAPPECAIQFSNVQLVIMVLLAFKYIAPPFFSLYTSLKIILLIAIPFALLFILKILVLLFPSRVAPLDDVMFNFLFIEIT